MNKEHLNVKINENIPACFGSVRNPKKNIDYVTIDISLERTDSLEALATRQREEAEKLEETPNEKIFSGYEEFKVEINDKNGQEIDVEIRYLCRDGSVKKIILSEEQRSKVLRSLNKQCKHLYRKNCEGLVFEAREKRRQRREDNQAKRH